MLSVLGHCLVCTMSTVELNDHRTMHTGQYLDGSRIVSCLLTAEHSPCSTTQGKHLHGKGTHVSIQVAVLTSKLLQDTTIAFNGTFNPVILISNIPRITTQ